MLEKKNPDSHCIGCFFGWLTHKLDYQIDKNPTRESKDLSCILIDNVNYETNNFVQWKVQKKGKKFKKINFSFSHEMYKLIWDYSTSEELKYGYTCLWMNSH